MKSTALTILFISSFLFIVNFSASADVRLPRIFGDHMVLQRGIKLPVWGWAEAGEKITLTLKGKDLNVTAEVAADGSGQWKIDLPVLEAGGPYVMTVTGNNSVIFNDVMVGEVWLCSGQSNMEVPVGLMNGAEWWKGVLNYEKELESANIPKLRLFNVATTWKQSPIQDVNATCAL